MDNLLRSKFLVNIKSLTSESKFIRREEQKHEEPWKKARLRYHRVCVVRKEARITNLAYAYAAGKTYRQVEVKVKNLLTPQDIHRIFLKLQRKGLVVNKEAVKLWFENT